ERGVNAGRRSVHAIRTQRVVEEAVEARLAFENALAIALETAVAAGGHRTLADDLDRGEDIVAVRGQQQVARGSARAQAEAGAGIVVALVKADAAAGEMAQPLVEER